MHFIQNIHIPMLCVKRIHFEKNLNFLVKMSAHNMQIIADLIYLFIFLGIKTLVTHLHFLIFYRNEILFSPLVSVALCQIQKYNNIADRKIYLEKNPNATCRGKS